LIFFLEILHSSSLYGGKEADIILFPSLCLFLCYSRFCRRTGWFEPGVEKIFFLSNFVRFLLSIRESISRSLALLGLLVFEIWTFLCAAPAVKLTALRYVVVCY